MAPRNVTMRFLPGDIVQHPDLPLVGQVLTCELTEESYVVLDFSTGKTKFFYDVDDALVHYTEPGTTVMFRDDFS